MSDDATVQPRVLAMVLAGGEGSRLYPLTSHRSKPSVPFGGRYRIVDFVLSNFINSQIFSIYLLVQYKSQSLIEHVRRAWELSPILMGHFVTVVPPQMREGPNWFQGTSDAIYQNLNLIRLQRPGVVAVFGADHVYRMDIRQMLRFHLQRKAEVTVAALPQRLALARSFGVIDTDDRCRILEFQEKPEHPKPMPDDPERAYVSMGNYLFNTEVLIEVLEEAHRRGEKDLGKDVLPRMLASHRLYAYDFCTNVVPGTKSCEESPYWRDVGTIDAYWHAHQDLLGLEPPFDLFNPLWPIRSGPYDGPIAKVIEGNLHNSIIGAGSLVNGATVRNSMIRQEVLLEPEVQIEDCIIMDYCIIRRGSRLRRVIVDRYNVIPQNSRIGFDLNEDARRYHVDATSGIVTVPQGMRELDLVY